MERKLTWTSRTLCKRYWKKNQLTCKTIFTTEKYVEEIDRRQTIFYKGKNYIPKDQELWQDIVKMYHDHETAGHPGELKTYNGIRQNYWWPGLTKFVKNYMQECSICQQFEINQSPSNPAYIAIEGANINRPFACCSMDLITDLHQWRNMMLSWSW
jgi:Integrase zinc binding domain